MLVQCSFDTVSQEDKFPIVFHDDAICRTFSPASMATSLNRSLLVWARRVVAFAVHFGGRNNPERGRPLQWFEAGQLAPELQLRGIFRNSRVHVTVMREYGAPFRTIISFWRRHCTNQPYEIRS
jgi:hypothetical protein